MDHQTIPLGIWFSSWTYITVHSFVKAQKNGISTSSTAQGGGGSFKNRKPMWQVGCCESRMAQRIHWWTERWLRSPLFLSLSLTTYLLTYQPVCLSIYLSIFMAQLVHNAPTRRALLENKQTKHYEPRNDLSISTHRSMDQLIFFLSFLILPFDTTHFLFSRGQIIWIHNPSICIFAHLCNTNPTQVASMHWKNKSTTQVA